MTVVFLGLRVGRNPNLVPRVFSLFNMVAAQEKTLAHSRSHGQNLQRGRIFIQNGKKSEKIWVRDMAKAKINKMAEEAEVQFKKKKRKKSLGFSVPCFFFVILKLGVMGLSILDCGTAYR